MSILIGIDLGGSTTKIVGFTPDRQLLGTQRVNTAENQTGMYDALEKYLHSCRLSKEAIDAVILTGVGASFITEDVFGIPTKKIPEFEAIGRGGLILSQLTEAVVVSMGTGTAYVRADKDTVTHLGGSGVGGGTLYGLSSKLLGEHDIINVAAMAEKGQAGNVDLLIGDIFCGDVSSLPPELTASNFGKIKSGASDSDIAAALFHLVFETVGMLAVFACKNTTVKNIVLTGALAELPPAKQIFDLMSRLYEVNFIIPQNPVFATAIGAVFPYLSPFSNREGQESPLL